LFFQAIKIDEALSQYLGEAKNLPVEDGTFFNILYRHIIFNVFFNGTWLSYYGPSPCA
jgi:hypothetical protein